MSNQNHYRLVSLEFVESLHRTEIAGAVVLHIAAAFSIRFYKVTFRNVVGLLTS